MGDQTITRADLDAVIASIAALESQIESLSTRMDNRSSDNRLGRENSWDKKVFDEMTGSEGIRSNHSNQHVNFYSGVINDIPLFYGGGEEFMDWEIEVDRFFGVNNVPEDKQAKKVANRLKFSASWWWDGLVVQRRRENRASIRTWRKMKQLMRDQFLPKDYEEILRRRKKLEREKELEYCIEKDGLKELIEDFSTIGSCKVGILAASALEEVEEKGTEENEVFHTHDHYSFCDVVALEEKLFVVSGDDDVIESSCEDAANFSCGYLSEVVCEEFEIVCEESGTLVVGDNNKVEDEKVEVHIFDEFLDESLVFENSIEEKVPLKVIDEYTKIKSNKGDIIQVEGGVGLDRDARKFYPKEEWFNMDGFFEKIPESIFPELEFMSMPMIISWGFKKVLHVSYTSREFAMEVEALDGGGENSGRVLFEVKKTDVGRFCLIIEENLSSDSLRSFGPNSDIDV